jgi:murein DD-endopeptidase MepM/ murein hydrolase activator NlpD
MAGPDDGRNVWDVITRDVFPGYGTSDPTTYGVSGLNSTVPPPVSLAGAISTLPPRAAPVDWRKAPNYFTSEWVDPKTGSTRKPATRTEAYAILDGIARTLPIWEQRLSGEVYAATGQALIPKPWYDEEENDYYAQRSDKELGKTIEEDKYYELEEQYKAQEAASTKRVQSDMELMALKAIADLKSYQAEIEDVESRWPEDPKPKTPTGGTQGAPYKITPQQFLAGLAMQETSSGPLAGGGGYVPSWASGKYTLTQGFGPTDEQLDSSYTDENGVTHPNFNLGYDYGIPENTPIDAATGGTVIAVDRMGSKSWGTAVKIRDAEGNIHNYGHLNEANVKPGDVVSAGDIIALSGNTGASTGPHLSYDVKKPDGFYFEPTKFVSGAGGDAGGGYDRENETTGAYGRYQFLPQYWDWYATQAGYPGADIKDPEAQEAVALWHVTDLLNRYGDPRDVAAIWYMGERGFLNSTPESRAASQNGGPSVTDYADSVFNFVAQAAKLREEGIMAPDGTYIAIGGSSGSGSGGSGAYDPLKAKQDAEDRKHTLWERELGREESRAGEVDRRYGDVSQRMKDYLTVAGDSNGLLADVAAALGNEAKLAEMNQGIQDDAIATSANVNAAVKAGKLDYRDAMAGPIWSNSLGSIQKELEAVRAALQTAPPGFADSILATIPKSVPMPYNITDVLDLPDYEGEYWGNPSTKRYGLGTIPRFANGTQQPTWREEPDIALYNSGGTLSPQRLAQLRAWGFIDQGTTGTGTTTTVPAPPPGAGTSYKQGYIPLNATLPPDFRTWDNGEWLDAATEKAIAMISAGNSSFATAWGLGDLTPFHGQPASTFGAIVNGLRARLLENKDAPAVVATFGKFPNVDTVWVPDPANPATSTKATPGGQAQGYGGSSGNIGIQTQTAQYGGTYGGGMDAYDSARIALEKEQLALQREIAKSQMQLDQDRFALEQQQFGSQQEYQAAQIRWNDAKAALDEKNFLLQQTQSALQEKIFEDSIRRYEIETGMAREQLDMSKIRQEADLVYQSAQLELARQSGALNQAEYEERKRQFDLNYGAQMSDYEERKRQFDLQFGQSQAEHDERVRQFQLQYGLSQAEAEERVRQFELTFNYQKEKDQKQLDIERAKTTVEYLSNPKDAVRSQFWYASQADPVGTAYDLFTGEDRGQKTYGQAYEEDANLFMESMKPYNQYATGSDDFVRDVAAILGDSAKSNKATGFEEVLYNPTGAPIMVLNNEQSKALGFVPNKGKQFGAHVREGRAS